MLNPEQFKNLPTVESRVLGHNTSILATFPIHEIMAAAASNAAGWGVEDYHWMLGNMIESYKALGFHWTSGEAMYNKIEAALTSITFEQIRELWDQFD